MTFNSLHFALFFPIVLVLYYLIPRRWRWQLLLVASCYFYAASKLEYLALLLVSAFISYLGALGIYHSRSPALRRCLLTLSICSDIGILFVFKYFDFTMGLVNPLVGWIAPGNAFPILDLILPVGISFYTFQTVSYTIDVYRGDCAPETNFARYGLFVTFFPQLVAGPIERASDLMPQLFHPQRLTYAAFTDGLKLIAWGLFKKVVIADRLALVVNIVYGSPLEYKGPQLVMATVFFALQIYCDFSGYCDIAVGAARMLGIQLTQNFRNPYLATSVADFWRRWHVSLSEWFRAYVYIPLGGSRVSTPRTYRNIFIVFLISGLWHGANWTFVVWGLIHGICLIAQHATSTWRQRFWAALPATWTTFQTVLSVLCTFILVNIGWVFFRAQTVTDAWTILSRMGIGWGNPLHVLEFAQRVTLAPGFSAAETLIALATISTLLIIEIIDHRHQWLPAVNRLPGWGRWAFYYALVCAILALGKFGETSFIYFQF